MPSSLHDTINALASDFAHSLLSALRGASLEEIIAETSHGKRGPGRPRATAAAGTAPRGRRAGKGGRLRRRSANDIAGVVAKITSLLQANPKGLRAEQIRSKLGLDPREMPRPLAEGLRKKVLSKKGRKRATTYFAGGKQASKRSGKKK
jgi:hypothetical protein